MHTNHRRITGNVNKTFTKAQRQNYIVIRPQSQNFLTSRRQTARRLVKEIPCIVKAPPTNRPPEFRQRLSLDRKHKRNRNLKNRILQERTNFCTVKCQNNIQIYNSERVQIAMRCHYRQ